MKSIMPIATAIAVFLLLASIDASQRPAFAQCETVADEEITKEIYAKIAKNKSLAAQVDHINVSTTNRVVKLTGWTNTKGDYETLIKIVSSVQCVKMINTQMFGQDPPPPNSPLRPQPDGGGCGPGTKPCGDICIPDGEKCGIGGVLMQSQDN